MTRAISKTNVDTRRLIERYIDPDWDRYGGRADARTREGVPVWALIGYLRIANDSIDETSAAYAIPRESVEAAVAYYEQNKQLVDSRILLNSA